VSEGGSYDPETIALLRNVLDAAWHSLSPEYQARTTKSHLAERVLKLAAPGERDPARLRVRAIVEVIPSRPQLYKACEVLQLSDKDDVFTEIVATRIVELAKTGERDPDRLCSQVLDALSAPRKASENTPNTWPGSQFWSRTG
jgi:hypothetical protein